MYKEIFEGVNIEDIKEAKRGLPKVIIGVDEMKGEKKLRNATFSGSSLEEIKKKMEQKYKKTVGIRLNLMKSDTDPDAARKIVSDVNDIIIDREIDMKD